MRTGFVTWIVFLSEPAEKEKTMANVFISYSHNDEELRQELEKHLAALRHQGVISIWNDRRIAPGQEIDSQISAELDSADIILLLVSADMLASDYCYDVEMKRAMEKHEQGTAQVIPVILRPCDWHAAPFGRLNAVPTDGRPVVNHATLDDGFLVVAHAVRQAASSGTDEPPSTGRDDRVNEPVDVVQLNPRSSNLRVKREFTDLERHVFLSEVFEYIARYFENSLQELNERNSNVQTDFRRIDSNRFEARAFVNGQEQSLCGIWLGSLGGDLSRMNELLFSYSGVGDGNTCNESMSVSDNGYTLFLEPIGMAQIGQQQDPRLTHEGAAEYFWTLFIEELR